MEKIDELKEEYKKICDQKLSIHMERGWPSKEQLELLLRLIKFPILPSRIKW